MSPFSRPLSLRIVVAGGLAAALLSPAVRALAAPPSPAPVAEKAVAKTIELKYLLPSKAALLLRQTTPRQTLPDGIAEITGDDTGISVTLRGKAAAVASAEVMLRLLDVKNRIVRVEMRLIETRLSEKGEPEERLLQSPSVMTINNTRATIGADAPEALSWNFAVTPHINGDNTVTVAVDMKLSAASGGRPMGASATNKTLRLRKQGEWTPVRQVTLSADKKIQEAVASGNKTIPPAAYPLYRLDISAAEVDTP